MARRDAIVQLRVWARLAVVLNAGGDRRRGRRVCPAQPEPRDTTDGVATAVMHPSRVLGIFVSIGLVALATVALLPARSAGANTNLALVLVIVVLGAAVFAGRPGGIAAALTAAFTFDFLLTQPYNSLRIASRTDIATTVLLATIGVIAGELVERARRNGARAAAVAASLRSVYDRAALAAGSDEPGRLVSIAVGELTRMFDLKSCRFVAGPVPSTVPELNHRGVRIPADVDPISRGLVALPVRAHGHLLGNLIMAFPTRETGRTLTADDRHAALAIADELGVGLLRFH